MCIRCCATTAFIAFLTFGGALTPSAAMAQEPEPADEPPPRLESSTQAALIATTGNASPQTLGFGGEFAWRPMPWVLKAKAVFAQTETDDVLSARSTWRGLASTDSSPNARHSSDNTTSCAICLLASNTAARSRADSPTRWWRARLIE